MAASNAQPLLKTHVETGDVEGILDGTDLAVYKAIPFASPPVGDLMQQYWVNFAKTSGNPNGEGLPSWPVYEPNESTVMQFLNGASLIPLPNQEKIGIVDRFMKYVSDLKK